MRALFKGLCLAKLLWLLCTATLLYAADRAALSPETVPFLKWLAALLLAFWGGITMLLQKFAKGDGNERWELMIVSGVASSLLAGVVMFMAGMHFEVPSMLNYIFVTIAGYGGSRTLDAFLSRLEKNIGEAKV